MPQKPFWEIITDQDKRTFEVINAHSVNDEWLNEIVSAMVDADMPVQCSTPLHQNCPTRASVVSSYAEIGFKEEVGLWQRVKNEFQTRSGKRKNG